MNTESGQSERHAGTDETSAPASENGEQSSTIPRFEENSGAGSVQEVEGVEAPPSVTGQPKCATLADVAKVVKATSWLWPKWLPRGHVSLLVGAPGYGKTTVVLDIVARLLGGDEMPDDRPGEQIDRVMWVWM